MKTAYLLAFVDTRRSPPAVVSVGVYSDNEKSITVDGRYCVTRLADMHKLTYDDASRELIRHVMRTSSLQWVLPLMQKQAVG